MCFIFDFICHEFHWTHNKPIINNKYRNAYRKNQYLLKYYEYEMKFYIYWESFGTTINLKLTIFLDIGFYKKVEKTMSF